MNPFQSALRKMARDLDQLKVRWAIVGGLAVSVRVRPRFTNDLVAAVVVSSDGEAERLVAELRQRGWSPAATVEDETSGRLRTVRLVTSPGTEAQLYFDLLFASAGIEAEVVAAATPAEALRGLKLPVAAIGHLIAMKLLSESDVRVTDRQDIIDLIGLSEPADLDIARASLDLIIERGYSRGKDLHATFDRFIALAAQPPDW